MLLVARKNLFSERTRLVISVGGVALSVFLITFLLSLFRGWNEKVGGFVEEVDADVWVAREGTTDFLAARIAGQAQGGEILVSALLKELTESAVGVAFGEGKEVELKGLAGQHRVFEVVW